MPSPDLFRRTARARQLPIAQGESARSYPISHRPAFPGDTRDMDQDRNSNRRRVAVAVRVLESLPRCPSWDLPFAPVFSLSKTENQMQRRPWHRSSMCELQECWVGAWPMSVQSGKATTHALECSEDADKRLRSTRGASNALSQLFLLIGRTWSPVWGAHRFNWDTTLIHTPSTAILSRPCFPCYTPAWPRAW